MTTHFRRDAEGNQIPSVVYHKETGEAFDRFPVDAKEMVATGEYDWNPPAKPAAPEPAEAAEAPAPARGPGRPRKSAA